MSTWLWGPPMEERDDVITLRSLRLDIDVVRDVFRMVESATGSAVLVVHGTVDLVSDRPVDIADLSNLSDSELLRLRITSNGNGRLDVDFREGTQPSIIFAPGVNDAAARGIARYLLDEGKPRTRWTILRVLPAVLVSLVIAAVASSLLVADPFESWPQNALALVLVVVAAALSGDLIQQRRDRRLAYSPRAYRGHRVDAITRERIRSERANTHRDLRVGAITGSIAAIVGAIAGAWLG